MDESKKLNAVIDVIMLAGTILLRNGSEIYRVEDTMIRIAHSQGIMDCNVLAMPAAIFFSIENTNISRMKRVTSSAYNIEKVCDVNQISRQLVSGQLDLETAFIQLKQLNAKASPYTNIQLTAAATLSAPFFSIMFGGNVYMPLVQESNHICFHLFSLRRKIYPYSLYDSFCRCSCFWFDCTIFGRAILACLLQLIWSLQVRSCLLYQELP